MRARGTPTPASRRARSCLARRRRAPATTRWARAPCSGVAPHGRRWRRRPRARARLPLAFRRSRRRGRAPRTHMLSRGPWQTPEQPGMAQLQQRLPAAPERTRAAAAAQQRGARRPAGQLWTRRPVRTPERTPPGTGLAAPRRAQPLTRLQARLQRLSANPPTRPPTRMAAMTRRRPRLPRPLRRSCRRAMQAAGYERAGVAEGSRGSSAGPRALLRRLRAGANHARSVSAAPPVLVSPYWVYSDRGDDALVWLWMVDLRSGSLRTSCDLQHAGSEAEPCTCW